MGFVGFKCQNALLAARDPIGHAQGSVCEGGTVCHVVVGGDGGRMFFCEDGEMGR